MNNQSYDNIVWVRSGDWTGEVHKVYNQQNREKRRQGGQTNTPINHILNKFLQFF